VHNKAFMENSKDLSAAQKALHRMGLTGPAELALHLPFRYEDDTRLVQLGQAKEGEVIQFEAQVQSVEVLYRPRRQLKVQVKSHGHECTLRFFNFYPSQLKQFVIGQTLRFKGEVRGGLLGYTVMHPLVQKPGTPLPEGLTPVYASTQGLPQSYLRKAVLSGLKLAMKSSQFEPTIPQAWEPNLPLSLKEALWALHCPSANTSIASLESHEHPAWKRLKAEELLAQQLSQHKARQIRLQLRAPALRASAAGEKTLAEKLLGVLPFELTRAQKRVSQDIEHDLGRTQPMHRLLQGDVGSGKTVVAALAAAHCIQAGWQCALMAPTEILAAQHFDKLLFWLEPLLLEQGQKVVWLTGSQKKKDKQAALALIESGEAALVIGTHAVIQDSVRFKALGLAIIDEQHRFGVAQRLALRQKNQASHEDQAQALGLKDLEPHMLMMTATPIPRTLAMSYFADLDVSTLDELPPGRTPVMTKVLSEHRRLEVIERIKHQLALGQQVYWVCPLIEESEKVDLVNATQTHLELTHHLAQGLDPKRAPRVALLHSKMAEPEKKEVMQAFKAGHTQVLVSTTVIEVGVDVPNASLMVIEHAERFGLSQLHQLRGRVGRGQAVSACVLLYSTGEHQRLSDTAKERLRAMVQTQDGFEIARRDLEIRGPGEFLGARQSGAQLMRFADPLLDVELMQWARETAPKMWQEHPEAAQRHLMRWQGIRAEYLKA
jgi:ATP-dependent DNA helicase RecG